jgi:hypothetical protein
MHALLGVEEVEKAEVNNLLFHSPAQTQALSFRLEILDPAKPDSVSFHAVRDAQVV